jgi:predicted Rossmann fold flavoprotein
MDNNIYDIVVIGGGPSGMMAAIRAGRLGARVLVLEKNKKLGVKLLATGNSRCNITNISADLRQNIGVYGRNAKFLFSVFAKFGVADTLDFFLDSGVVTKIEDHGRVFPQSNQASDVQAALMRNLSANNVVLRFEACVKNILTQGGKIEKVILADGEEVFGKNFIIATGGKSYPATGSNGDGYLWLNNLGHTVNNPRPALTPLVVREDVVKRLEGLNLQNVRLEVWKDKKKITDCQGGIIFTSDGVSGPVVIDLSGHIGALLPAAVMLRIDFYPGITEQDFAEELQYKFHHNRNKILKNIIADILPDRLAAVIIELSGISGQKEPCAIAKRERDALVRMIKEFPLNVERLKGFEKAMLTAGGVDVKEVNPANMRSRLYHNLFLAGEILDLSGPTGGYNLQICWSTGYIAGENAASHH